ncbi:hypothetical protein CVM73_32020 [Bradyrhizobium forestalis]|uniref:Uncharacterized protein n=1 Tax=Bradyrhizobium forestalis TaxID=1419263 RepID=A0A2M8R0A2_9BRAD|nr:hypothetical protein [Bradyrhizobium forestalis]PJG51245.1 hypothetical protein CVM73_32020 [Bradyrhizobium forestalis]
MKLMQRQSVVLGVVLMGALASGSLRAETTSVDNGSNSATITQSGDPSKTDRQVRIGPGYSSIEQRNGSNSAIIIQRTTPGADTDPGQSPDTQAAPGDDDPPPSDADVYRQVRKGATPQSQQTLDNLMKALGLQKKM